jgi:hypothetical protein
MTSISRRAVLAGVPASAASVVVVPSVAFAEISGGDAALLALCDEYKLRLAHIAGISADVHKVREAIRKATPFPSMIRRRDNERLGFNLPKDEPLIPAEIHDRYRNKPAKRDMALSARKNWQDECAAKFEAAGVTAHEAEVERMYSEAHAMTARILAIRATTPAGMLAKLEIYDEEPIEQPEVVSVYNDLRALCGLEPSATVEG